MSLKIACVSILALGVAFAALGCLDDDHRIGGCELETIEIGTAMTRGEAPGPYSAWLRISSVGFAGTDVYAQAAFDLTAVLDTLGVVIYTRSDLEHVREGPCWPPYNVGFLIEASDSSSSAIRSKLLTTPIARLLPAEERPYRYGTFFITCGKGHDDWWTLWYVRLP